MTTPRSGASADAGPGISDILSGGGDFSMSLVSDASTQYMSFAETVETPRALDIPGLGDTLGPAAIGLAPGSVTALNPELTLSQLSLVPPTPSMLSARAAHPWTPRAVRSGSFVHSSLEPGGWKEADLSMSASVALLGPVTGVEASRTENEAETLEAGETTGAEKEAG